MSIRAFPADKTCVDIVRDGAKPPPDADISGLGVILAFTLSAYLTFILVLASYVFGQVDASLLNIVDTNVFRIRPLKDCSRGHRPVRFRISLALRQAIIALSDQQIVTGIAIMAAGFQGLRLGGIDSYHYQTVIYLAWMSSSVHLSAISMLAPLLKQRPALRIWRFTGMFVLLVLLVIGLVPTVGNAWGLLKWQTMVTTNTRWGVPAVCFWGKRWGAGVNPDAVLSYFILVISYGWKVGSLFDFACSAYRRWVRYPVEWIFECLLACTARKVSLAYQQNSVNRLGWLIIYRLVVTLWVPYCAIFETLASFSMSLWISCLGLIFGTIQIAVPRQQNQSTLESEEDVWGFGQLVPLILLIQPFSVVWEHLIIARSAKEQEIEHAEDVTHEKSANATASLALITSGPSIQETSVPVQSQRPPQPLLQHLADYKPIKPSKRINREPTSIEQILTGSRVFHAIVLLTQPALLVATIVTFKLDTLMIGTTGTFNWAIFCYMFVNYVALAWLVTFCFIPWSTIGKIPPDWQTSCNRIGGQVEDGLG